MCARKQSVIIFVLFFKFYLNLVSRSIDFAEMDLQFDLFWILLLRNKDKLLVYFNFQHANNYITAI